MRQAALAIMQAIPHPLAKVCREAILSNDLDRLPDVNPGDFSDPHSYFSAAQVVACVKKLNGLIPDQEKILTQKAEESFFRCEEQCRQTNQRLAKLCSLMERPFIEDEHDRIMYEYIERVQRIVRDVLGPLPKSLGPPVFSGGSSFLNRAKQKTLPHKLGGPVAVTSSLSEILHLIEAQNAPRWTQLRARYGTEVVPGNRFETVDKDSRKKRGICVEPLANVCWQLSVGTMMRDRLKRAGVVDISFSDEFDPWSKVLHPSIPLWKPDYSTKIGGQKLHQHLAEWASCEGFLATSDQSDASDTVAYMLVRLAFGKAKDWFHLLNTLRSPQTRIRGKWVKLQKFSSMGNGYTFELETLLFYALVKAIKPDGIVSVYGDDIIYEADIAGSVAACLRLFGFTQNLKKSYSTGPFRESCGGDFFSGVPVRPVFLKGDPRTPTEWFTMVNQLIRISRNQDWGLEPLICRLISENVPKWARYFGPPTPEVCDAWIETEDSTLYRLRDHPVKDHTQAEKYDSSRGAERPGTFQTWKEILGLYPEYGKRYRSWLEKDEAIMAILLGAPSRGVQVNSEPVSFKRRWYTMPLG